MSAPVTTIVGRARAAESPRQAGGIVWRNVATEAKLLLVGIPMFLWTIIPIYHLFLFAISPKQEAFAGKLWPDNPTLRNFEIVFGQKHYFLSHFWLQLWNSLLIAVASGVITLLIATGAARRRLIQASTANTAAAAKLARLATATRHRSSPRGPSV